MEVRITGLFHPNDIPHLTSRLLYNQLTNHLLTSWDIQVGVVEMGWVEMGGFQPWIPSTWCC